MLSDSMVRNSLLMLFQNFGPLTEIAFEPATIRFLSTTIVPSYCALVWAILSHTIYGYIKMPQTSSAFKINVCMAFAG